MKNLPKMEDGRTAYPCIRAEVADHKLLYWKNVSFNRWYDNPTAENEAEKDKWNSIYHERIDIGGVYYFPYPEYTAVKEAVVSYDLCH